MTCPKHNRRCFGQKYAISENLAFNLDANYLRLLSWSPNDWTMLQGVDRAVFSRENAFWEVSCQRSIASVSDHCWKLQALVQKKLLPEKWQHDSMQTLRDKIIHHGASIRFVGNICTLRLNASYRDKTAVETILSQLKQEVQIQQVRSHNALRKYQKWIIFKISVNWLFMRKQGEQDWIFWKIHGFMAPL